MKRSLGNAGLLVCALALVTPSAIADPPEHIFGVHSRMSRTCGGGPGFADLGAKAACVSVFEDHLEIRSSTDLDANLEPKSRDGVDVEFTFHFQYSDYCGFRGYGIWSNGKILLTQSVSEKPLAAACRLELVFERDTVRLSDPQGRCSSLCTAPTKLHGVSYKRQVATK